MSDEYATKSVTALVVQAFVAQAFVAQTLLSKGLRLSILKFQANKVSKPQTRKERGSALQFHGFYGAPQFEFRNRCSRCQRSTST